jgi:hypothetical protein
MGRLKTEVECPQQGRIIIHHRCAEKPHSSDTPLLCELDDGQFMVGSLKRDHGDIYEIDARTPVRETVRRRVLTVAVITFLELMCCLELRNKTIAAEAFDRMGVVNVFDDYLS